MAKPTITIEDLQYCLGWCIGKYGQYGKEAPKVILMNDVVLEIVGFLETDNGVEEIPGIGEFYGIYDGECNEIHISRTLNQSLRVLCETIIHEYIHFIQIYDEDTDETFINPNLEYSHVEDMEDTEIEHQAEFISLRDAESLRKELLRWRKMILKN